MGDVAKCNVMIKELFPKADPDILMWCIRHSISNCDSKEFLTRLILIDSNIPVAFKPREEGGFIPDPRLLEKIDTNKYINGKIEKWLSENDQIQDAWDSMRLKVSEGKDSLVLEQEIMSLVEKGDTKEIEMKAKDIWPFRVKGDKAIRRTRFYDVFKCFGSDAVKFAMSMRGDNYVKTLITTWYYCTVPEECKQTIQNLAKLQISGWDVLTKEISSYLKSHSCDELWRYFVELGCLSGYRLLPWPGYDADKDTEELATGGLFHDMFITFKEWAAKILNGPTKNLKYMTFRQYLESGVWLTAGSSSVGKVEIEYQGKVKEVKCRKNMVIDALTIDDIEAMCKTKETQTSTAFVKNELARSG